MTKCCIVLLVTAMHTCGSLHIDNPIIIWLSNHDDCTSIESTWCRVGYVVALYNNEGGSKVSV